MSPLTSTLFPKVFNEGLEIETPKMNRIGRENLKDGFVDLFAVLPSRERALLGAHVEKLATQPHRSDIGSGTALLCH
jgi:hypothetical protein